MTELEIRLTVACGGMGKESRPAAGWVRDPLFLASLVCWEVVVVMR